MQKISINLLINVLLLLAGTLFLVFHNTPDIMLWGARVIGALFVLPSIAFLAVATLRKNATARNTVLLATLPAVGGACFGIMMIAHPALFTTVLTLLLGMLLCALGMFHMFYLWLSRKSMGTRLWHYVFPMVVLASGASILCIETVKTQESTVMLLSGISLLFFNITSLVEYLLERKVSHDEAPEANALPTQAQSQEEPSQPSSGGDKLTEDQSE